MKSKHLILFLFLIPALLSAKTLTKNELKTLGTRAFHQKAESICPAAANYQLKDCDFLTDNPYTYCGIGSCLQQPARNGKRDNNLEILRLCKKYDVPTILGSDAHISFQIADYDRLFPLLAETDFPDELIMNYWPKKFLEFLGLQ